MRRLGFHAYAVVGLGVVVGCGSSGSDSSGAPPEAVPSGGSSAGGSSATTGGAPGAGHGGTSGGGKAGTPGAGAGGAPGGAPGQAGTSGGGPGGAAGSGGPTAGAGGVAGSAGGVGGGASGVGGSAGGAAGVAGMGGSAGGEAGSSGAGGGGVCGSGDHSPCVTGGPLPIDCDCAKQVCQGQGDAYCCNNAWDLSCVERAYLVCTNECMGGPIELQTPSLVPASDVTITKIVAGDAGGCAIDVNGDIWCWGLNEWGQLNDGTFGEKLVPYFPRKVPGVSNVVDVAIDQWMACAVDTGGVLSCWGDLAPQPGGSCQDGNFTPPKQILTNVKHVVLDGQGCEMRACALENDGSVWCWGELNQGLTILGGTAKAFTATPTQVMIPPAVDVVMSPYDVCAILEDGTARCWGENQVATGNWTTSTTEFNCLPSVWNDTPDQDCASPLGGITSITTADNVTCVVANGGGVTCIGGNSYGALGVGGNGNGPAMPPLPAPAVSVRAGGVGGGTVPVECALLTSGDVYCWGVSGYGSAGTAPPDQPGGIIGPEKVLNLSNAVELAYTMDSNLGLARTMDGKGWAWGGTQTPVGVGVGPGIGSGKGTALAQLPFKTTP